MVEKSNLFGGCATKGHPMYHGPLDQAPAFFGLALKISHPPKQPQGSSHLFKSFWWPNQGSSHLVVEMFPVFGFLSGSHVFQGPLDLRPQKKSLASKRKSRAAQRPSARLPGHTGSVNEVCFHPKEPIIASVASDRR